MKHIAPINTKRLTLEMREMDMDLVEDLCAIPASLNERTSTALLRGVATSAERRGAVADPRFWSVNERIYVIACYMAATMDDGPDFPVGKGHFSDYLLGNTDYVAEVPFQCQGMNMVYSPLLGYQAEMIETLIEGATVINGRPLKKTAYSWWCCAMAATVRRADDDVYEYTDDASYEDFLKVRIAEIRALKDSEYLSLFDAYHDALARGAHLVYAVTTMHGVLANQVSVPDESQGVPELAPARFPAHSAISERAREIMGFVY